LVEVAGIEPASFGTATGLLRAQPDFRPRPHQSLRRVGGCPVAVWFSVHPRDRVGRWSS